MKILITGTSKGIGLALAKRYLSQGHEVYGLDLLESSINDKNYHHFNVDVSKKNKLPDIENVEVLINNAGLQNCKDDIDNNLKSAIYVTEKYGFNPSIKSILFNASASSRSGFEFPEYVASKAGMVGYMKNVASRLAPYGVTVNSISLGGVLTESNKPVMDDGKSWEQIMEATPMKKWMTESEVCDWVYFLTMVNKSMSGEDILIDNGEYNLNSTFVWPK
ncbi:MAG: SDR family oxidoreductase [Bacilli bacterium]|nr:SDR family oxidoreductase [Bacilli bacterium]